MPLVAALTDALADAPERVLAAWLFGSRARGDARPHSDVDVALLLDAVEPGLDPIADELTVRLGRALFGAGLLPAALKDPLQVVVLNEASADLVQRVLRDGVLLLDRDPSRRIDFEVELRNRYYDMTPVWRVTRRLGPGVIP